MAHDIDQFVSDLIYTENYGKNFHCPAINIWCALNEHKYALL